MKIIIFDTETNGLPKKGNKSSPNPDTWPYVCQLSWLVFDDVTKKLYTRDYIIKLPDGVTIPKVCSDIHGITNERMRNEGVDISGVLQEFTSDWMKCQVLVAHNFVFDNKVMQTEYIRNQPINWLGRHRKIEYCTMLYGKKFTNILRPSKFHSGTYQKPPKLIELHEELFETTPGNLHNSLIDVFVTFRCLHQMIYERDLFDGKKHVELTNYYKNMCGL